MSGVRILGLSGSLRRRSYNRRLLEAAAAALPTGATLDVYDDLAAIPPFDEDVPAPASVERLREALARAGAVLFATPEYNASVPGQLKNALDWASRPFPDNALRDRPVAVIGASTGLFGAVWAQAELRKVLAHLGARVVEDELPVGQAHDAFGDGGLIDPDLRARLACITDRLVALAGSRDGTSLASCNS